MRLKVRVQPKASKPGLAGWQEDCLKVRLASPPVEGAANDELLVHLAKALGLPKSRLSIVQGHKGRDKVVELPLEVTVIMARLTEAMED